MVDDETNTEIIWSWKGLLCCHTAGSVVHLLLGWLEEHPPWHHPHTGLPKPLLGTTCWQLQLAIAWRDLLHFPFQTLRMNKGGKERSSTSIFKALRVLDGSWWSLDPVWMDSWGLIIYSVLYNGHNLLQDEFFQLQRDQRADPVQILDAWPGFLLLVWCESEETTSPDTLPGESWLTILTWIIWVAHNKRETSSHIFSIFWRSYMPDFSRRWRNPRQRNCLMTRMKHAIV